MDARSSAFGEDPWLRHALALRRLAASLVRDQDEARDLVQETWLRAGAVARSRAWLTVVLRNLVRDRARERGRREHTERAAAREERVPSSAEIAAELELAQLVAREVAGLEEPYRLALHLRYFEGLAPEAIAARCGLPLETVRTHLRRGLVRLRERLDRAHGCDRRAWVTLLVPLAGRGAGLEHPAGSSLLAAMTTTMGALMSTKLLASAAAVILVTIGLFLWTRTGAPLQAPAPASTTGPTPELARALERALPAAPAVSDAREATGPAARTDAAPAEVELRSLEGRVVIVDEEGAELLGESGMLTLATGTSREDHQIRDLAFEDGRFSLELRAGEWVVFGRLVARGRQAVLPEPSPIVPGDEPLLVRGRWLARGRIRVLDAVSRQELSGIEVRCADGWRANPEWTHPGDDPRVRTVVEDGVSPLELPDRTHYTPYWVHAPGHAWARVDFDHRVGGERTIELSPFPSAVTVHLEGTPPANAFVRLYPRASAPPSRANGIVLRRPPAEELPSWVACVSVRAAATGPTRIEDFDGDGEFLVSVEVGEYEDRLRLGSAEVQIPESGSATVTVRVDGSLLDVPRTHLHGSIRVPAGLEREGCVLTLERLEGGEQEFRQELVDMSFPSGEPDLLRWDAGLRRTGVYVASLLCIQYRTTLETRGPGQETEVELVIPPLVSVRVEVVDQATGAPLEAEVSWHGALLPEVSGFSLSPVRRDPGTGVLGFVAPAGQVEVEARLEGYRDAERELELYGATATCRLELVRATGIRVLLREGGAALPVGMEFLYRIVVRGPDEERLHPHVQAGQAEGTIHLDAPGRVTLEFPELDGFEPLEPRSVDVAAGELVELVVQAVRQP